MATPNTKSTPKGTRAPTGPAAATVDDSHMIWRELTSKNGKKFRVGYERSPADEGDIVKPSGDTIDTSTAEAHATPPNEKTPPIGDNSRIHDEWAPFQADSDVYWEYHDGIYYKPAAQVTSKMDITEYQLGWNYFGYYDYKLQINCSVPWSYTFYDESGDSYGLDCDRTGWHNVCYDSSAETIIKIHAERWIPPPK